MRTMTLQGSETITAIRMRQEIRVINHLDAFKALQIEWEQLEARASDCALYMSYMYCEIAAISILAQGGTINIVMIFDDAGLVALWPVTFKRHGLIRMAIHLSCGTDEEYGAPLIRGIATVNIFEKILTAAMQLRADVLEITYVEDGSLLQQAIARVSGPWVLPERIGQRGAFSIELRKFGNIEEYYKNVLSAGLRRNLKRQLRNLKTLGQVDIGWCTNAADAEAVLRWLHTNKQHWAMTRGLDTFWLKEDKVLNFFIVLAHRIDHQTAPMVAYLKLDGVPIAASISWMGNQRHEWAITTYDEAYYRYGVGALLLEFLVTWSHAHGRDFDFRFFVADYKARWATRRTMQKTRHVFLTPLGHLIEADLLAHSVGDKISFGLHSLARMAKNKLTKWRSDRRQGPETSSDPTSSDDQK